MQTKTRETEKLLTAMMVLFNNFAVTQPINYPDGTTVLVPIWINARAEQQFNLLKKQYEKLKGE